MRKSKSFMRSGSSSVWRLAYIWEKRPPDAPVVSLGFTVSGSPPVAWLTLNGANCASK